MSTKVRSAIAFVLIIIGTSPLWGQESGGRVFPQARWQRRTPASQGLDEAKLAQFQEFVGGRGCIVRHGYLVDSWGEYDQPHDVASAVKPFYSYLMLKAFEQGKIASLDDPVVSYWEGQPGVQNGASHKDLKTTFRHLGFQTACLGFEEPPGTAFDYNDATMGFFWDTLINKVYGVPWDKAEAQVIEPLISQPLQFQDGTPNILQRNTGRFRVSARDFCRFGWLFLNHGRWEDKQLLREDLAILAVTDPLPLSIPRTKARAADTIFPVRTIGGRGNQCDHNGGYSWMWWLNRKSRDGKLWFPDVPDDFYACLGHGGNEGMAVFPSQDLVVSWITKRELHQNRDDGNRAFSLLVEAVTDDAR